MDVLWLRMSKQPSDPGQTLGRIEAGRMFIMLDRNDYWQCAYVIPKGGIDEVHARGLDAFRADLVRLAPFLRDRVHELATWDDVKLLTVAVNRLDKWHRPGLLCIGDAAHAMSPVGGVGINLAIQDAVAAANILVPRLRQGAATPGRPGGGATASRAPDTHDAARCRWQSRTASSAHLLARTPRRSRHWPCGWRAGFHRFVDYRRASSAWASDRSTSATERTLEC